MSRAIGRICDRTEYRTIGRHEVLVLADPAPRAFCVGLARPRIVISSGTLAELAPAELAAVLAHEARHVASRDALRLLALRVLADALFFLPIVRRVSTQHSVMVEVAADEAATREVGTAALARALLSFSGEPEGIGIAGARVDALCGRPPRLQLPLGIVLGALTALAAFGAVMLIHAPSRPDSDGGAATSSQICVLLLLVVPLLVAAAAFVLYRPKPARVQRRGDSSLITRRR